MHTLTYTCISQDMKKAICRGTLFLSMTSRKSCVHQPAINKTPSSSIVDHHPSSPNTASILRSLFMEVVFLGNVSVNKMLLFFVMFPFCLVECCSVFDIWRQRSRAVFTSVCVAVLIQSRKRKTDRHNPVAGCSCLGCDGPSSAS
jgi:hypothetical protein